MALINRAKMVKWTALIYIRNTRNRVLSSFFTTVPEKNDAPQSPAQAELNDTPRWKESCPMGPTAEVRQIDMKVIEPYKKVISHAGYCQNFNSGSTTQTSNPSSTNNQGPAIIVFSACHLPDRSRKDYSYVMDNIFMYVLTTLHQLVSGDYILIYFHNARVAGSTGNNMPTFSWLKRCYQMIDRKLKKNLKGLYLVHPTFWLKAMITMTKPFIR